MDIEEKAREDSGPIPPKTIALFSRNWFIECVQTGFKGAPMISGLYHWRFEDQRLSMCRDIQLDQGFVCILRM